MLTLMLGVAFALFAVPSFVLGRRRPSVMDVLWMGTLGLVVALVYAGQFGSGLGVPQPIDLHVQYGESASIGEPWSSDAP